MKPEYVPTPFSEALMTWLTGTRKLPKYSCKLANFVTFRKAYRVIRLIPIENTPSYMKDKVDPNMPLGRYHEDFIYLTNVIEGSPWTTRNGHGDRLMDLRGVRLDRAVDGGGSLGCYSSWEPREDWDWEDCTLDFWERYMKVGTCLFDYQHRKPSPGELFCFGGMAEVSQRWTLLDEHTAQCKWCGEVLHRHRKLHVDVRAHSTWSPNEVKPGCDSFRCNRCHRRHAIADMYQTLDHGSFKSDNLCPSCFLARAAEDPSVRRRLLPSELTRPAAAII